MSYQELKRHQAEFMNASFKPQTMPVRSSNRIINYIAEKPLRTALQLLNEDVAGSTVLSICAGPGDEALWLHNLGAKVTATDISEAACQLIQKRNPAITVALADAEQLPYADGSFDYVMVKHGLHHLPRPILGLYEMLRVSRKGILVMEAHDSWVMRGLVVVGVVQAVEESGNFVYRFTRHEVKKLLDTMFMHDIKIKTEWYQFVPLFNRYVYPALNSSVGFALFRYGLWVMG